MKAGEKALAEWSRKKRIFARFYLISGIVITLLMMAILLHPDSTSYFIKFEKTSDKDDLLTQTMIFTTNFASVILVAALTIASQVLSVAYVFLIGIPSIVGGWLLLRRRRGGATLTLITGAFYLLLFPLGTAIGILAIRFYTWDRRLRKALSAVTASAMTVGLLGCSSGYSTKDDKVMYDGDEITVGKDFVVLNEDFAKDSAACYYHRKEIKGCDIRSFTALDDHYAKDTSKVYYCEETPAYLRYDGRDPRYVVQVENANAAAFKALGFRYGRDDKHAYYKGEPFRVKDIASLETINEDFAHDAVQVYFKRKPVIGSDGKTFVLIDKSGQGFAKDSRFGYYYFDTEIMLVPCHTASFEKIDGSFAKDDQAVYYGAHKLKGANPSSFVLINQTYSRSNKGVYYEHKKIEGADALTFKIMPGNDDLTQDYYYTGDKSAVYWEEKTVKGVDPATFKALGRGYGRDNSHVYFQTKVVAEADVASFEIDYRGDTDAKDARHVFSLGNVVVN